MRAPSITISLCVATLVILVLVASANDAQAYLDPGVSAYLFNAAIGCLAGLMVLMSDSIRKAITVIRRILPKVLSNSLAPKERQQGTSKKEK
jgi:hypothetical protein